MAMRRSRGVRSFTTLPPMRISPAVGVSRPAIIRRRVVFPEPEGPRKTRNSPSRVSRSTSLTAPSSPSLNTLVSFRVSTTAIQSLNLFESLKDALVLGFRVLGRVLRTLLALRHLGEHCRDHPAFERLVNRGSAITRITHVGRPAKHVAQHLVLIVGRGPRIIRDLFLEVRHGCGEAREIVELPGHKAVMERVNVVNQELLRAFFVFG